MTRLQYLLQLHWEICALQRKCIARRLRGHQHHFGQIPILKLLESTGQCSQRALANLLHCSDPAIAVSIRRLEKNGLVKKEQDKNDLRHNVITLTEQGLRIARLSSEVLHETLTGQYNGFTDAELDNMTVYFERIKKNLGMISSTPDHCGLRHHTQTEELG